MPNWCENTLTVTGPADRLKEFKKKFVGKYALWGLSDWEREGKSPKQIMTTMMKLQEMNGQKHWGTKWDIDMLDESHTENELSYSFLSAWEPPTAWLAHVCTHFLSWILLIL